MFGFIVTPGDNLFGKNQKLLTEMLRRIGSIIINLKTLRNCLKMACWLYSSMPGPAILLNNLSPGHRANLVYYN
jgi:hypothetical protein